MRELLWGDSLFLLCGVSTFSPRALFRTCSESRSFTNVRDIDKSRHGPHDSRTRTLTRNVDNDDSDGHATIYNPSSSKTAANSNGLGEQSGVEVNTYTNRVTIRGLMVCAVLLRHWCDKSSRR